MGAWDVSPEARAQVAARKQHALDQITVGRRYRHKGHPGGEWDVVVTGVDATGYVSWRRAKGPGPADVHRSMYCLDFTSVYTDAKDTARP